VAQTALPSPRPTPVPVATRAELLGIQQGEPRNRLAAIAVLHQRRPDGALEVAVEQTLVGEQDPQLHTALVCLKATLPGPAVLAWLLATIPQTGVVSAESAGPDQQETLCLLRGVASHARQDARARDPAGSRAPRQR